MISLKRSSLLLFGLLLTLCIAACSNPLSSNTTTGNTPVTTTKNTTTGYGKTTTMTPKTTTAKSTTTPTQKNTTTSTTGSSSTTSNALIHTTQVKLNGKMITVLTNAKGLILYYKLNDPRPASACTATCATAWPPVLAMNMNMNTMISSSMQLPHKLMVYKTANGDQIEYDGHPLYTYAGDNTPGMFSGRGIGNVWYLVSLGL